MAEFKHLEAPYSFKQFYSNYPEGYSIYEALLDWINQINEMITVLNLTISEWEQVKLWVDSELKNYSEEKLNEWLNDGTIENMVDSTFDEISILLAATVEKADTAITKANTMASGSPKGVYDTLVALQTAYPTGAEGAYLVASDGNWYYWNGSSWVSGGIYQGTEVSDNSISGIKLTEQYNYKKLLVNTDDLSNIHEAGIYYWNGDVSNPVSQPLPLNGIGIMRVTRVADVWTYQEVWSIDAPHLKFTRKIEKNGLGITDWVAPSDVSNRYIAYIGDSISVPNYYQEVIKKELDAYIHNYSYSGAAIVQYGDNNPYDPYSFVSRSTDIPIPAYLKHVFVFMGTNDFSNDVPLGSRMSENPNEFRRAIRTGIKNLMTRSSDLKIASATPMFKATVYDQEFQDILTVPNGLGLYLKDYINAMIEVCEDMGVPVINTFAKANINRYNYQTFLSDRIHPNFVGHQRLGHLFSNFLKEVF